MFIILLLSGALLFSWLSVYCINAYAVKKLLDLPNQRSSHRTPTPRGGGLGIVIVFSFIVLVLFWKGVVELAHVQVLACSLAVAAIGFWDDHRPIPALYRFGVHLIAAFGALYFIDGFPPIRVGGLRVDLGIFSYVLGAFFLVWLLNLFNFMDGIDGIAVSEVVFVAGALSCFLYGIDTPLAIIALSLAVSSVGFLVWNWPPASIFMGDVGSGFLGFVLAVLILESGQKSLLFLSIGMILMAVFIVDASFTLLYRFFSGQKWYQAHCCHAYQHAARQYGHLKVTLSVWAINLFFLLPIAVFVFWNPAFAVAGFCGAYLPLLYLAVRLGSGRTSADV